VPAVVVVYVQVPAGTTTVSPFDAELMAVCTSFAEQEAAERLAAWQSRQQFTLIRNNIRHLDIIGRHLGRSLSSRLSTVKGHKGMTTRELGHGPSFVSETFCLHHSILNSKARIVPVPDRGED